MTAEPGAAQSLRDAQPAQSVELNAAAPVPLIGPDPVADAPIKLPEPPAEARPREWGWLGADTRAIRLRIYSYCLTLSACVFALMTFMYVVQGQADGDGTFLGLGVLFGVIGLLLLWGAVRITRHTEPHRTG